MGFLSLLGMFVSPITTLISQYGQAQKAKFDLQMAQIQAATDLAKTQSQNDLSTLVARLGSTDPAFKNITFFLLMLPIVITCLFPETGASIFKNLSNIPQYYQYLVLSVYGAVWGIKNVVMPMSNNSVAKKMLDKKEFFDYLRHAKGALPDAEVQLLDKALDEANNEQ